MERYSVHLKLLGMAVLWGASWPMGRMLGQSLPPLTGGAVRFVLASVLLLGWLFARSRFATLAALSARQWLGLAVAASVGVCCVDAMRPPVVVFHKYEARICPQSAMWPIDFGM